MNEHWTDLEHYASLAWLMLGIKI